MDASEARLLQLGYRQDLKRALSYFSNFAVTFSVGSILSGVTSSFSIGYSHGGPAVMVWSWILHSVLALSIILTMAELCSSMPVAGGMFSWSYHLGGRHRRLWSWLTGWLNLTGWVGGTASAAYACAFLVSRMVLISTGGASGGGTTFTDAEFLGLLTALLVLQGLINFLPTRALAAVNQVSVAWNGLGLLTMIVLLPSLAVKHQSARFVFTTFIRDSYGYVKGDGYTSILSFLFVVYCLSGIDTASHMAEETRGAERNAAKSTVAVYLANVLCGLGFVLALLFSLQETSPDALVSGEAGGLMVAQIVLDVFTARFQSSTGAVVALGIPAVAIFLGGASSVTTTSRVVWAFARDGALPMSSVVRKVHPGSGVPTNAVVVSVALSVLISLPLLSSTVAFYACVSIAILGGATAYLIPSALKVLVARGEFERGPVNMGVLSLPVNAFACVYLLFICVSAALPTQFPVTSQTLNYAPIAWGIVVGSALLLWFLPGKWGARHWYATERTRLATTAYSQRAGKVDIA